MAREWLPNWEIIAWEASDSMTGCWDNPSPGFVSTSTKYTTQFACFPQWQATVDPDGGASRKEFFRGDEYGQYLESFADAFGLRPFIQLRHHVERIERIGSYWKLVVNGECQEPFDAVVLCTGLAADLKSIESSVSNVLREPLHDALARETIRDQTIVVLGGGESAVDYANRLAHPQWNNHVYLSLRSGIRVSPRYHPVRGVPSDFLRNRLMLSADPVMRNFLGQIFVLARIKYQHLMEKLFPGNHRSEPSPDRLSEKRKQEWTLRLTRMAKDGVFNMFHNKSDDFLDVVGDQRISIIGPPVDCRYRKFVPLGESPSDDEKIISIEPDLVVPAIGYRATLAGLSNPSIELEDFYLGCCHQQFANLFAVGFARPIIGNVPSISEMQARYVCGLIAGKFERPANLTSLHRAERKYLRQRYPSLDTRYVYPVEMFSYCDDLAKRMAMRCGPRWYRHPKAWWRTLVSPATTLHYFNEATTVNRHQSPVYMPTTMIVLILLMKPLDWLLRGLRPIVTHLTKLNFWGASQKV